MLVRTEAVGVKVFRNATHIHALRGEGYFFEECLRKIKTVWAHSEGKNLFQTSIQICTCGKPYSCRWIFLDGVGILYIFGKLLLCLMM